MPAIEELLPVPGSRLQALPTSDVLRTPLAGGPARLRVGLVVEHFDPMRGGLEQWSFRFARELVSRGHEVHVVSQEFVEATRELAVVRHPVRCGRSRLAFGRQARVLLEPLALDVIHDMGAGWYCDVFHPHGGSWLSVTRRKLDMLPGWLRGLKRWLNPLLPRQRQYDKLMARQYADNGQVLLALSRSVADDFMRFHDVGPERIRVVYNGVDTEEFSPACCAERRGPVRRRLGIGPDTLLALVVGHNFHLKGVPTLLDAMGRLGGEERPIHLAVVGGKHLRPWQRRAERLGVGHRVSFLGTSSEPLDYYAAADLYVHPTFYDTCSLVVLEAAACGLPVITSRCNGVSELFREGVEAFLISDPGNGEELAATMRLLVDDARRLRMGRAARQAVEQYTLARNVDEILEVYREVVRRRGGLPRGYAFWLARVPANDTDIDLPAAPKCRGELNRITTVTPTKRS
jgi:UDP-glucose:(heptosyl)LPS alpha-1,3-glucosyltransferase